MSLRFRSCMVILFICLLGCHAAGQSSSDLGVEVEIDKGDDATYYTGEPIFVSFRTSMDAYVVIYNIDCEGRLNLLFPGSPDESVLVPGYETVQIPEHDDDYSLKVTGGYGEEFICAIASTVPLRIPTVFNEDSKYRVSGDPDEILEDITEEMLDGRDVPFAMDVSHFYIGDEEEDGEFPPLPPFPFPPFGFGCLQVISKPSAAKVYLDGKPFGRTPVAIAGIPPGTHELVVKKRLYDRYCEEIFIEEGEKERIRVRLKWNLW